MDKRAIARCITLIENEGPGHIDELKALYPKAQDAYIIGITGPPGAGKSTLTDKLVQILAEKGENVGVIAVDPTSPFTKGALLGDRVRMSQSAISPNVFIRSMGTRGSLGGLSKAAAGACAVLGAYGCKAVFVETVGVGQSEVDIAGLADTTIVVVAPGLGDDIQAAKAGIMEIGDIFAVNKADREGAGKTYREILAALEFSANTDYMPPVCQTVALNGQGVLELHEKISAHRTYLEMSGRLTEKRAKKKQALVREIVKDELLKRVEAELDGLEIGGTDPFTLAHEISCKILKLNFNKEEQD